MADPDYRVVVEVGSHTYDVTYGDAPDYGVTLPLTVGWAIPDTVEFFPSQRNPASGSFGIVVPTIDDVADIEVGDLVRIEVYTPAASALPWQAFDGAVTQLGAQVGDRNILTVYFSDTTWLLGRKIVGLGAWPLESIGDRITRICSETVMTLDRVVNEAGGGLLAARAAGSPTNALEAIRSALKDDADRNLSFDGVHPVYGRVVYAYEPATNTLYVRVFERRVTSWPAELGADGTLHHRPGEPDSLDGCDVQAGGSWARLSGDQTTYVIVDGIEVGDPDAPGAVPYVRNTSLVDGPGPSFPSATARLYLGESLLPDDSVDPRAWRTDTVRHLSYLDPDPVAGWIGSDGDNGLGWTLLRPTIIDAIDPTLTLDGRTWIAGVLTGARLTIPPGGRFYTDLTLRPDLIAHSTGTPSFGAATYADIPPALTYADLDPLLTYRDLRLIGA